VGEKKLLTGENLKSHEYVNHKSRRFELISTAPNERGARFACEACLSVTAALLVITLNDGWCCYVMLWPKSDRQGDDEKIK
jgi:hypothetical protein